MNMVLPEFCTGYLLQLRTLGVAFQTVFSGVAEIIFPTFVLLLLPIHLAIGIIEGHVTVMVAGFVWKARPEILEKAAAEEPVGIL